MTPPDEKDARNVLLSVYGAIPRGDPTAKERPCQSQFRVAEQFGNGS